MGDMEDKIRFLLEGEKLKTVERIIDTSLPGRMESSAEHTYSSLLLAMVFRNEIIKDFPEISYSRLFELILVHDQPEVYAGDVSLFDTEARKLKKIKERKAARQLFPILPNIESTYFHETWLEYDAQKSLEAKVAARIDKLDPIIQNICNKGVSYKREGITIKMIDDKKRHLFEGSDILSSLYRYLINELKQRRLTAEYSP